MKRAIFKIFQFVYETEKRPDDWLNTTIVQIYKGKGDMDDLSNHRNIHMKDYLPKTFETIFVEKSKQKIIKKCSKYQIGAIPSHRPQEHLFTIKSVIALYTMLGLALIVKKLSQILWVLF